MDAQVAIVGAGPVGLWLAAELRLAGVSVTVFETRLEPDPHSKALTIHPRTIEILACRGLAEPLLAEGVRIPSGHFAVLDERLDFSVLDTPYPFTLAVPQARTEELLEQHARAAGADIRRGRRVTAVRAGTGSVEVTTEDGTTLEAAWLVGCDGVRSLVRESVGIPYVGTPSTVFGWLADVTLAEPPETPIFSYYTEHGQVMGVPLPGGIHRLVGIDAGDTGAELTLDDVRARVTAVAGTDWGLHTPVWLSKFGNAARQAERYRTGRVLLAGDAAHQHMPAGGVGMNVGIQDAANLGWKLAAVVQGRAGDELLDSYHDERHPVGRDLLRSTQAQTALMSNFSPAGRELRALLGELIGEQPQLARSLAERLSGLAVRYPAPVGAHPLVGTRASDRPLRDGGSLFTALRSGRPVLVDVGGESALVRPDGYVAWVGASTERPAVPWFAAEAG
ncbi:FAD-dependent monooxygenase [Cryptosporangium japonicum]|uniref:Monooxygenase n=1 Tax=Cryptosporangium japonicum TaxID=80872 RepID=A0ABN0U583_9ACTN